MLESGSRWRTPWHVLMSRAHPPKPLGFPCAPFGSAMRHGQRPREVALRCVVSRLGVDWTAACTKLLEAEHSAISCTAGYSRDGALEAFLSYDESFRSLIFPPSHKQAKLSTSTSLSWRYPNRGRAKTGIPSSSLHRFPFCPPRRRIASAKP